MGQGFGAEPETEEQLTTTGRNWNQAFAECSKPHKYAQKSRENAQFSAIFHDLS